MNDKVVFEFNDIELEKIESYINLSKLVITNDSAAMHIAVLFGVKSIVYSGQGHISRFIGEQNFRLTKLPCSNCNWRCIYPDFDQRFLCVENLSRMESLRELRELFESAHCSFSEICE